MGQGITGKILHVDLNALTNRLETPAETFYRKYFGGAAMGLYYILKDVPQGADPQGPENVLTFMLSPD